MNDNLQQLKDIHLPPAISWWPFAPGWYLVAALVLFVLLTILYGVYQKIRKAALLKYTLAKLKNLRTLAMDNPREINIAIEVSMLLRRTALYYFPRENIAGLSGQAWLNFLNESANKPLFTLEMSALITDIPYQKNTESDLTPLIDLAKTWITTVAKKQNKALGK